MTDQTSTSRRDALHDEIILGVLDAVEDNPAVTQRVVARELGIALGLANTYLKRCVHKGLVKVSQVPRRRFAYYLTPQGFREKSLLTARYLTHSLSFFRRARLQCGNVYLAAIAGGQKRIVLLGLGDLAEIASLVAREHPIEIVDTIAASSEEAVLRERLAALGRVDAIVVTALENPREVYLAAVEVFDVARVHAPAMLRIHPPSARVSMVEANS
jgi:predicted transcriptional regulator